MILAIASSPAGAAEQPAEQPTVAEMQAKVVNAAAKVQTIADLSPQAAVACNVEPWQATFSPDGDNAVRIERSPTMTQGQARCLFAFVSRTRFRVTNSAYAQ